MGAQHSDRAQLAESGRALKIPGWLADPAACLKRNAGLEVKK